MENKNLLESNKLLRKRLGEIETNINNIVRAKTSELVDANWRLTYELLVCRNRLAELTGEKYDNDF